MELAGKVLSLVGNILDTVINIILVVVIAFFIYKAAHLCYDYGYRIFTEEAVSATVGREVEVTIPVDFSVKELGQIFEDNGLTRDSKLFILQYYCSEYRENIKGGTYTLSTTMTAEEMFEVIANVNIEKDELRKAQEDAVREAEEKAKQKAEEDEAEANSDAEDIDIDMSGVEDLLGD